MTVILYLSTSVSETWGAVVWLAVVVDCEVMCWVTRSMSLGRGGVWVLVDVVGFGNNADGTGVGNVTRGLGGWVEEMVEVWRSWVEVCFVDVWGIIIFTLEPP